MDIPSQKINGNGKLDEPSSDFVQETQPKNRIAVFAKIRSELFTVLIKHGIVLVNMWP